MGATYRESPSKETVMSNPNTPGDEENAPLGGDEGTEENLQADNEVEEAMLEAVDPDQPPA
jgi:hypothetical protein